MPKVNVSKSKLFRSKKTQTLSGQESFPQSKVMTGWRAERNLLANSGMTNTEIWLDNFFMKTWKCHPYAWQLECFRKLTDSPNNRRVINVWPGAGKTRFGVAYGKWLFETGRINNVIVVSPTTEVRDKWQLEFAYAGIQLACNPNKDGKLPSQFQGHSTTYHDVWHSRSKNWFKGERNFVILDEIHHLGDRNLEEAEERSGWGIAAREAFDRTSNYILGTTGTLFRPDSRESMSFVEYGTDGYIKADYNYGYKRAFADGVVPQVIFPTWKEKSVIYSVNGVKTVGGFNKLEDISKTENEIRWNKTQRAMIDPDYEHMSEIIPVANNKLMSLRNGESPKAGGILFADNIPQLKLIKKLFDKQGISSIIVHSQPDCVDPKGEIDKFRKDTSIQWLLCVRMVSEGVDVHRLMVGVHASTHVTQLEVIQMIGRLLRDGSKEFVYFYMTTHPDLVNTADNIEEEIRQALEEAKKKGGGNGNGNGNGSVFVVEEAQGEPSDHILGGRHTENDAVVRAENYKQQYDIRHPSVVIAEILAPLNLDEILLKEPTVEEVITPIVPMEKEQEELSKKVNRLVNKAAVENLGPNEDMKAKIQDIRNNILAPLDGIFENQAIRCTPAQLRARITRINEYREEMGRAKASTV